MMNGSQLMKQPLGVASNALVLFFTALIATTGCDRLSGQSDNASAAQAATEQAAAASLDERDVARIVFIDEEQACECTRDRIFISWNALQAALGGGSSIAVERIHRDTQAERAERYRSLQPTVTVPGIYLLDDNGAVIELLQGEVTEERVHNAITGHG